MASYTPNPESCGDHTTRSFQTHEQKTVQQSLRKTDVSGNRQAQVPVPLVPLLHCMTSRRSHRLLPNRWVFFVVILCNCSYCRIHACRLVSFYYIAQDVHRSVLEVTNNTPSEVWEHGFLLFCWPSSSKDVPTLNRRVSLRSTFWEFYVWTFSIELRPYAIESVTHQKVIIWLRIEREGNSISTCQRKSASRRLQSC